MESGYKDLSNDSGLKLSHVIACCGQIAIHCVQVLQNL
jgi:hypothetical protein